MLFRTLEPILYQIDLMLRCADSSRRLLLKDVKHIDCARKLDRIDRSISITIIVPNDLKYPGTPETFQRLSVYMPATILGSKEGESHYPLDLLRELSEVVE